MNPEHPDSAASDPMAAPAPHDPPSLGHPALGNPALGHAGYAPAPQAGILPQAGFAAPAAPPPLPQAAMAPSPAPPPLPQGYAAPQGYAPAPQGYTAVPPQGAMPQGALPQGAMPQAQAAAMAQNGPQGIVHAQDFAAMSDIYAALARNTVDSRAVQAENQRRWIIAIILGVGLVHLPWILYLISVYGCFGSFIDLCFSADLDAAGDLTDEVALDSTVFWFSRIAYFVLSVMNVLTVDYANFAEVAQVSTGLGSFLLTKLIAANGSISGSTGRRNALAAASAGGFLLLFLAQVHLTSETLYPILAEETVLGYIDMNLPEKFISATQSRDSLLQYLQFLRLADMLIFGAALAMPTTRRS